MLNRLNRPIASSVGPLRAPNPARDAARQVAGPKPAATPQLTLGDRLMLQRSMGQAKQVSGAQAIAASQMTLGDRLAFQQAAKQGATNAAMQHAAAINGALPNTGENMASMIEAFRKRQELASAMANGKNQSGDIASQAKPAADAPGSASQIAEDVAPKKARKGGKARKAKKGRKSRKARGARRGRRAAAVRAAARAARTRAVGA